MRRDDWPKGYKEKRYRDLQIDTIAANAKTGDALRDAKIDELSEAAKAAGDVSVISEGLNDLPLTSDRELIVAAAFEIQALRAKVEALQSELAGEPPADLQDFIERGIVNQGESVEGALVRWGGRRVDAVRVRDKANDQGQLDWARSEIAKCDDAIERLTGGRVSVIK